MWLILLAFAATITTAIWYSKAENDVYMLNILAQIFWGATIMAFINHLMGYLMEGGEFIEITLEATVLGLTLILIGLIVWEVILIIRDPKGIIYKRQKK